MRQVYFHIMASKTNGHILQCEKSMHLLPNCINRDLDRCSLRSSHINSAVDLSQESMAPLYISSKLDTLSIAVMGPQKFCFALVFLNT